MSMVDDLAMCCHRTGGQLAAVAQGRRCCVHAHDALTGP